ncbi:hypothetical protein LXA43DRAFT_235916 [Ganoderma leucocontextum]|nr:hypothetical protein LXA43DRAFT_235916 [Ganoderma leucocontextum]
MTAPAVAFRHCVSRRRRTTKRHVLSTLNPYAPSFDRNVPRLERAYQVCFRDVAILERRARTGPPPHNSLYMWTPVPASRRAAIEPPSRNPLPLSSMNSIGHDHEQLHSTFGVILAGNFVGFAMYGLTTYQTYQYFQLYPQEGRGLKLLILALLAMDTLHLIESSHMCYYYLVLNYFNPPALLSGTWSARLLSPTMGAIVFLTQGFYVRRLYLLNQDHSRIVIALVPFMLTALGFSIAAGVQSFELVTFSRWSDVLWLDITSLAIAVAADIMCAFGRHSPIYIGLLIPATRSYSIAVVAVLNSRKELAGRELSGESEIVVQLGTLQFSSRNGGASTV